SSDLSEGPDGVLLTRSGTAVLLRFFLLGCATSQPLTWPLLIGRAARTVAFRPVVARCGALDGLDCCEHCASAGGGYFPFSPLLLTPPVTKSPPGVALR